jgi:uncharacterized protein YndB with AHSA1/START domain
MAPIVESVEIARRPEDVFAYVSDASHLPEWQESVVSARREGDGPMTTGSKVVVTRHVGPRDMTMTMEFSELNPPTSWTVRGIDGPIRGTAKGRVEPLEGGQRSRVTIELDFEGHGLGKVLVPLVARRQASKEMPKNMQHLRQRLEGGG